MKKHVSLAAFIFLIFAPSVFAQGDDIGAVPPVAPPPVSTPRLPPPPVVLPAPPTPGVLVTDPSAAFSTEITIGAPRPPTFPGIVGLESSLPGQAMIISREFAVFGCDSSPSSCGFSIESSLERLAETPGLRANERISAIGSATSQILADVSQIISSDRDLRAVSSLAVRSSMDVMTRVVQTAPPTEKARAQANVKTSVDVISNAISYTAATRPAIAAEVAAEAIRLIGQFAPMPTADRILASSQLATKVVSSLTEANLSPTVFASNMTVIIQTAAATARTEAAKASRQETLAVAQALQNVASDLNSVAETAKARYSGIPEVVAVIENVTTAVQQSVLSAQQMVSPAIPTIPNIIVSEASPS